MAYDSQHMTEVWLNTEERRNDSKVGQKKT